MTDSRSIEGRTVGQLTVLRPTGRRDPWRRRYYLCRCTCGNEVEVHSGHLTGQRKSCGCLSGGGGGGKLVHGHARRGHFTPTYHTWSNMVKRCTNPGHKSYGSYAGRLCDRWNPRVVGSAQAMANFVEDMGERPDGTTIGRLGDEGGYSKENCAWQTPAEQNAARAEKRRRAAEREHDTEQEAA